MADGVHAHDSADDTRLKDIVRRAANLVPVLRQRAHAAEKARRIPENTIADLMACDTFRILQPKRFGGYELDYGPAQLALAAELGRGCGSSAWVGILLACHNWLVGMYPDAAQNEVWGLSNESLVGTAFAAATSSVKPVDDGFRLSGRWKFASGIDHCQWVILGASELREDQSPLIRWFLLPRTDYAIDDTWYAAGLRASGSNDVLVDDIFVPMHRALSFDNLHGGPTPGSAVNSSHIYAMPVMMVFPYNVFAPMVGTALGSVEAFIERTRERTGAVGRSRIAHFPSVQTRLSESAAEIDCAQAITQRDSREFNALAREGDSFAVERRVLYRRNVAYAATLCRRAVDRTVQSLGAHGIADDSIEQRAFRDVYAMNSHIAVQWDANAVGFSENALGLDISDKRL